MRSPSIGSTTYWRTSSPRSVVLVTREGGRAGSIEGKQMPAKRPAEERFWAKVDKNGPAPELGTVAADRNLGNCWLWTAYVDRNGYGSFRGDSGTGQPHRWSYERSEGPVPDGLVLDHLCRRRHCVRPAHMEPTTIADNLLRGHRHRLEIGGPIDQLLRSIDRPARAVALACGIHQGALSKYRTGDRVPHDRHATALANYFGVTVDFVRGQA